MLQTIDYAVSQIMPQAQLAGTFVSLATFQSPDLTQPRGPTGNLSGLYSDVSGLESIPCMDAPPSLARIQATEVKDVAEIMSKGLRTVLLNKCFTDAPNWSGDGYRVTVDGILYDLLGAENDSQATQTRCNLQLVTI